MPGELILVVEDNDNNRMLIRDVLRATGYHVVEAENAEDGLRMATEHRPALILMDIQLPGMSGPRHCCGCAPIPPPARSR